MAGTFYARNSAGTPNWRNSHWLKTKRAELVSWELCRAAFSSAFIRHIDRPTAKEMMRNRKQNSSETLTAYFYGKLRLCQPLGLNLRETMEQVAVGLKSRVMGLHVCSRTYESEKELLDDILAFERIAATHDALHPQQKVRGKPATGSGQRRDKGEHSRRSFAPATTTVASPAASTSTDTRKKRTVKCYNCDCEGHYARAGM